jgi:predicted MFS family arabinose efflux permease
MYIPLGDSIGLSLAEHDNVGRTLGRFNSVRLAFLMIAGMMTFFGFHFGLFDFNTPVLVFLLSALAFLIVGILLTVLYRFPGMSQNKEHARVRFVWRKEYLRYYIICALFGGRKQIMIVFSPWVLIDLLGFKADTMSILAVIGSFIGIFFIPVVGKLIDNLGVRMVMIFEASAFILVYIAYGFLSKWVNENVVALTGAAMILVYLLNIIDRMSAQFYMVRSIYMRGIAVKPEDVTPSLSLGMAIDHVMAIVGSFLCGLVWEAWGPEYVFLIAGILSVLNLLAAAGIKRK